MMLQKNPQAITVGTPSSGANGNVHLYEFPGGVTTFLTGLGVLDSNYSPMNGRGVKIDVPVLLDANTIPANVDPYLSKAIELSFVQGYDALIRATSEGKLWVVQALHEASID